MIEKILAKSDGTNLIDHSVLVSKFALEIAKQNSKTLDSNVLEGIRIGALLHDIGKSHATLQKKLKKITLNEEDLEYKVPFRHNEIGWAFLNNYLNIKTDILDIILDVVYWHHGISNKMGKHKDFDIIKKLSDADLNKMIKVGEYLTDGIENCYIEEKPLKPNSAPIYYSNDEFANMIKTFSRACVITADRFVSKLGNLSLGMSDSEIKSLITDTNYRELNIDMSEHPYYGNERYLKQEEIVNDIIDNTTIIKGPAGFGKTLLGMLWNFKSDKKLIWVCPRNVVAESVYKSIIDELSFNDNHNISVELYLSGEVMKHNNNFYDDFGSDIIVTNIDNYLAPSINNTVANRLLSIINYDVVFDEYHELVGDNAMFACFVTLLKVRHQLTNCKTLLLSATPSNLHKLWDSLGSVTKILPSPDTHYSAPHQKKYDVNTLDSFPDNPPNDANLFVLNSITNAQVVKNVLNSDKVFHSNFTDKDRGDKLNYIYDNFGKDSDRSQPNKPNLVGTPIIQASLDISFKRLYESVLSPQDTVQRAGRCNRWGDYDETPSINIANIQNAGENAVREILYTKNLSNVWFDEISKYDKTQLTLDELYVIYNEYNVKDDKVLHRYHQEKYYKSLDELSKIHPKKYYTKRNTDIKTAGGNKLRTNGNDVFVICKMYNSDEYCDPFSVSLYVSHHKDFKEEGQGNILNKLLKTMRHLRNENDSRFDYNEIINNKYITLDEVRMASVKSDTPYIRFDKVYHKEYGLISKDKLQLILKNN